MGCPAVRARSGEADTGVAPLLRLPDPAGCMGTHKDGRKGINRELGRGKFLVATVARRSMACPNQWPAFLRAKHQVGHLGLR